MKNICHNFYRTIIFNASALGSKCLSLPFIVPFREMRVGNFMQHHQQAEKTAEYVSSICHLSISVIHFRAVPNKTIAGIRSK